MKRILRVGYHRYSTEEEFSAHIEFVKKYRDSFDEITLFTEFDHNGYRELAEMEATVSILKKRIPVYRSLGFESVGINLLCTLGHLEEAYDSHEVSPFGYVVNLDGVSSKSCLCPSSEKCLDYVYSRYSMFAESGADFIWIDDDVRTDNHGVVKGDEFCFCDNCISRYNSLHGTSLTREMIKSSWYQDDALRKSYAEMQREILHELCRTIRRGIHDKHPEIKIGIMNDASKVDTGSMVESGAVMGRPGGGFYNDQRPIVLFDKLFRIQYGVLRFPKSVTDIQYEFESFPFESFEKSVQMTELETSLAVLSGCNGSLYSTSWFYDREDLAQRFKECGKMWDTLSDLCEGGSYRGVYCPNLQNALYLLECGIPISADVQNSVAAFLIGKDWDKLSNSEIDSILSLGVYTDGLGAQTLISRGFGEKIGCTVRAKYDNSMCERFTDHDINAGYKGFLRNVFMNFPYAHDAYSFDIFSGCECISTLESVTGQSYGASAYVYENSSGQKICADGYMMPNKVKSKHKHRQIVNIFNYLSDGKMPVQIDRDIKVVPTVNSDKHGNITVMLTNVTLDDTEAFECIIDTTEELFVLERDGKLTPIHSEVRDSTRVIKIDNITPWHYVIITNRKI